tara:strand:+ start:248 stop:400 length:153 start_codon:yes stop_codon:yes gene_type:complete
MQVSGPWNKLHDSDFEFVFIAARTPTVLAMTIGQLLLISPALEPYPNGTV